MGELNFPQNSGSPTTRERLCMYQFKFPHFKEKYSVGFRMIPLQEVWAVGTMKQ